MLQQMFKVHDSQNSIMVAESETHVYTKASSATMQRTAHVYTVVAPNIVDRIRSTIFGGTRTLGAHRIK